MFTKSLWNQYADSTNFSKLHGNKEADVVIIGGGITGLSTAKFLAAQGKSVIVIDERKIGGGTTSHSTGNLYVTIDQVLSSLLSKYDINTVKQVLAARKEASDAIKNSISEFDIDCDYKTCPWYIYFGDENSKDKIEKEYMVAKEAGLAAEMVVNDYMPPGASKAMKIPDQAQFNPMRYVQGLANAIQSESCSIYENTRATAVTEEDGYCQVKTTSGRIKAKHVVQATHSPKGIMLVHTLLGPYREYGVACRLRGETPPDGIFWGYYNQEEKYSFRNYKRGDEEYLIVVGKPHKVGQAKDNSAHTEALEAFARKHFDVNEIVYRWGGQHYRPADLLPYIGRRNSGSNVFIASGYSTDGLVYGTLAGKIISDEICEVSNEWADLFNSTRHQPLKAAKKFISENANVARQYLKNIPGVASSKTFGAIKPGEGKIIEKDGHKLAVSRDDKNTLHVCSAICSHMMCVVNWNNVEKTWDCPCHGSRFDMDGAVLEGPAYHPLHEITFKGEKVESHHME